MPAASVGAGGQLGTTGGTLLTQHVLKQQGLLRNPKDEDVRASILRHERTMGGIRVTFAQRCDRVLEYWTPPTLPFAYCRCPRRVFQVYGSLRQDTTSAHLRAGGGNEGGAGAVSAVLQSLWHGSTFACTAFLECNIVYYKLLFFAMAAWIVTETLARFTKQLGFLCHIIAKSRALAQETIAMQEAITHV